jgi:CheY-like chemotaxis protein
VIERQVRNLVRLVDDLLDISRITQGRVSIEPDSIETAEVVARAVELARPLIEQRSHRLQVAVPAHGLPLFVDTVRIAQALSNILINAAKYTGPGGSLEVEADRSGSEVAIRIRDNGPGIPPELMPRLFDLFVQGKQTLDRRQGGLGIGLTVARSLVELHGGSIAARSDPGAGSEFTIRLPVGPASFLRTSPRPRLARREARKERKPELRILIVDDNEDGAKALAEGLRQLGYAVAVVHDPMSALSTAQGLRPDFALIDIGLPSMDGYELARELQSLEGLAELRLIAITGYGNEADRRRSQAAGFRAHLVKPVELAKLEDTLTVMALPL